MKKYDKSRNLNRTFENELKNWDNLLYSISSSDDPYRHFYGISFSTFNKLRKSNLFRFIIGHININSVGNKFEPVKKCFKDNI